MEVVQKVLKEVFKIVAEFRDQLLEQLVLREGGAH
jgi:hypothetical protein